MSYPTINIYCKLNEGTSWVNKQYTFYKYNNGFKIYAAFIVIQFDILCFYFHKSQAPYSLPYREKSVLR